MKKLVVVAIALTVLFAAVPAHGAIRGRITSAIGGSCAHRCWKGDVRITVRGAFECYATQKETEEAEKWRRGEETEGYPHSREETTTGWCSNYHGGGYESGYIVVHPSSTAGECVVGGYDRQKAAHPLYWLAGTGIFLRSNGEIRANATMRFAATEPLELRQRKGAVACLEINTDEGTEVPEAGCLPEFKPSVREELCATEILESHSREVVAVAKIRWHAKTAGSGASTT